MENFHYKDADITFINVQPKVIAGKIAKDLEELRVLAEDQIAPRLEKLDEREKLISSRYTEQFGAMEQAMTQFNSTKSMLENFIESWKKQK